MTTLAIHNGRVIDPALGRDGVADVVMAEDGVEAVEAVERERFDLILMDRRMGGKGFEQVIERTASDPRAIFFSSWGRRPKGENLPDSSDADLSLMQPFSVARVIETVRETLQLRKA